ncbi:hypothetical protein FOVG_14038 [Fusarium oxysporum f. sp. pisi HDV247]|uniref:Uncharacterized protein n=1 Tax=Fusarium oxysporum f. sp. pisi HDV247 TaxID=1080344 RepID=W9P3Q4_FUSOX|nr:hypothetical protein FOVG_14038 [Fusarium oxysporum f. sp. pisi HDV247]
MKDVAEENESSMSDLYGVLQKMRLATNVTYLISTDVIT